MAFHRPLFGRSLLHVGVGRIAQKVAGQFRRASFQRAHQNGVPDLVQDPGVVAPLRLHLPGLLDRMQGLMDIADEVDKEFEGAQTLIGRSVGVGQRCTRVFDTQDYASALATAVAIRVALKGMRTAWLTSPGSLPRI